MRIAILGAGSVGSALGGRWSELGHPVVFGLRPGSTRVTPTRTKRMPVADAVRDSEVVALAVPWPAAQEVLREAGDFGNRVLLDCTNPLGPNMTLDVGEGGLSGAERVARWATNARVVKIFNTTGANNMADAGYKGAAPLMLYAGDDAAAKQVARNLAEEIGFDPVDAGDLVKARELEHLAMLWIGLAMGGMGRNIAFALLRR